MNTEIGDNLYFFVRAREKETLKKAVELFYTQGKKVVSYKDHSDYGLICYWGYEGVLFPVELSSDIIVEIIWEWLRKARYDGYKLSEHGINLVHDGENVKGWEIYNEHWNKVGGESDVLFAVRPAWIWLGK